MATRDCNKISTSEILEKLKGDGDHTKFFYLYVSTAGKEHEVLEEEDDEKEEPEQQTSEVKKSDENPTENTKQPAISTAKSPDKTETSQEKRKTAMVKSHRGIIPKILYRNGWKKVYDKDKKVTYRALYFNTIPKKPDEDGRTHVLRVNRIRNELKKELDKLKEKDKVDFKVNSLLARPLLYDESALEEQMTETLRKTTINDDKNT